MIEVLPGRGRDPAERADVRAAARSAISRYVLEHLDKLVVKAANESGGYGMLVGPHSTRGERDEFGNASRRPAQLHRAADARPSRRVPTIRDDKLEGRHVDLRPYILYGKDVYVLPGGLTRVAFEKGRSS